MTDRQEVGRADLLIDANRPAEAMRLLGPYLAAHPEDLDATCVASRAMIRLRDYGEAIRLAGSVIAQRPDDDLPWRLIALAHHNGDHPVEAVQAAQWAVQLRPDHWSTHYLLAVTWTGLPRGAEPALIAAGEAVRLEPENADIHRLIGHCYRALDRRSDAEAAFRQALRINPDDARSRHDLADLALRRGRLSDAAEGFSSAVTMDPGHHDSSRALDQLVVKILGLLYLVSFVAAMVSLLLPPHPWIPALVTVGALGGVAQFWVRAGSRLRYYLRMVARSPLLITSVVLLVLGVAGLWARGLGVSDGAWLNVLTLVALAGSQVAALRWHLARGPSDPSS